MTEILVQLVRVRKLDSLVSIHQSLRGSNSDSQSTMLARDFLNSLLANQEVSINRITHDKYGRTVAELFKEKLNVQKLLVEKGHGKIYKSYAHQCDWTKYEE